MDTNEQKIKKDIKQLIWLFVIVVVVSAVALGAYFYFQFQKPDPLIKVFEKQIKELKKETDKIINPLKDFVPVAGQDVKG